MLTLTLPAAIESIETATDSLNEILEEAGCSLHNQMILDVALDELMSNVARYAYAPGTGNITLTAEILEDPKRIVLTLADSGVPYDPLKKEDPDTSLSAEERKIGGLGIFIVKQSMDDMTYAYIDNQNIVTITKNL